MQKLKDLFYKYLWLIILCGLFAVGGLTFWAHQSYQEHRTDSEIKQTQTEAHTAVNQAVESETEAANTSIERQSEDAVREKVIRPRLETARRNANSSKIELDLAKQKFNEKTNPHDANGTWADNCARLKRVFPDDTFEYCQQ